MKQGLISQQCVCFFPQQKTLLLHLLYHHKSIPSLFGNQSAKSYAQYSKSVSLCTAMSICISVSSLKKVVRRDENSLRSMVSSPLTSSKLKRSSISSLEGSSPPTMLMSDFKTFGNSFFVKRWFLSLSNSLNSLSSSDGMSSSVNFLVGGASGSSMGGAGGLGGSGVV